MDWKQRIGVLGVVLACTSVGVAKPRPVSEGSDDNTEVQEIVRDLGIEDGSAAEDTRQGGDTCSGAFTIPYPLPSDPAANNCGAGISNCFQDTGSTFTSGDQYHTNSCNGVDGRARDVVYKVTPTQNTVFLVTGCYNTGADTNYDARGWVYEGGCPGEGLPGDAEPLRCSDDGCGAFAGPPNFIFSAQANVTYYIVQDGWGGGRGNYGIRVTEFTDGAVCDSTNICADDVPEGDSGNLGDRFYPTNTVAPAAQDTCAEIATCPSAPNFGAPCDTGIGGNTARNCPPNALFCHGFFCCAVAGDGCDDGTGTAGATASFPADASVNRGGLNNRGYEGFWGVNGTIGGVVVWGEDYNVDADGVGTNNCTKTDFTVTYYEDNNGAPGNIVAGPFTTVATLAGTGLGFAGVPSGVNRFSMTHPPVCLKSGWVSVQGAYNPDTPECEFFWTTADLVNLNLLGQGRDDNHFWYNDEEHRHSGALMMGLVSTDSEVLGACCDDTAACPGCCQNNVSCADCPEGRRFSPGGNCSEYHPDLNPFGIVPSCGDGACCFADGSCDHTLNQTQCTNAGGTSFTLGVFCAPSPEDPSGVHCPPVNDNCANVTPANAPLPYQFTGRNDGATAEGGGCAGIGAAAWEAFTLSECSDLVIDYCGTFPAFSASPSDVLLADCCDLANAVEAGAISNVARIGTCCIDDPPGYEGNFSVTFTNVAKGTWYYPVKTTTGAFGRYTLNVSGVDCATSDCNGNGTHDLDDIVNNAAMDCNANSVLDSCDCSDWNANGRTDLDDYGQFRSCMTAPGGSASAACQCVLNADGGDNDLDLRDYSKLQACRTACTSCSGTAEGEAGCAGGNDTCATADSINISVATSATVCGTLSTTDEDWYVVTMPSAGTLSWDVTSEVGLEIQIIEGSQGCAVNLDELVMAGGTSAGCAQASASACASTGTYYLVVRPTEATACGTPYRATVSRTVGGCTPGFGACCRFGGCTANISQAACDQLHGHYNGDGTACGSCPALATNDECAGETVIPTAIPAGGLTFAIDRRALTSNPTDGGNTCEAIAAPKDASAWFRWTAPAPLGSHTIRLSLCCDDGGPLGDTLIIGYRKQSASTGTCAAIAADPIGNIQLCSDESADCGEQRAELCFISTGNNNSQTFRFQVQFKDNGGPDEERNYTLYATSGCSPAGLDICPAVPVCTTPVACPGTLEGEPNCATDYIDNTNNGCSPTNSPLGVFSNNLTGGGPDFQTPIGTTIQVCGKTGNYNSNGLAGTCSGGPNAGDACTSDANCPDDFGACATGSCVGGPTPGAACTADANCGTGGTCPRFCAGGTNDGAACTSDAGCPDDLGFCNVAQVERDRDWYRMTLTEAATLTWTAQIDVDDGSTNGFGLTTQVFDVSGHSDCGTFNSLASGVNNADCEEAQAIATVEPGDYAATVFGKDVTLAHTDIFQACGTQYRAELTTVSANTLPRPNNACASAPTISSSGRFSGMINTNGAGTTATADGLSSCDGDIGTPGSFADVYYRYVAPCTGRVTFDACQSMATDDVSPAVLLSAHTGCPANGSTEIPGGIGFSCTYFGCGPGGQRPTLTIDVVQGEDYIIRAAAISADQAGPLVVRVSDCTLPCE